MNYEAFKKELIERLEDVASVNSCELICQPVNKVNLNNVDSISFRREGLTASPTLYVEDMYNRFQNGKSINELVDDIQKLFANDSFEEFNLDLSSEMIKANCFPQLIGKAGNEELLANILHLW